MAKVSGGTRILKSGSKEYKNREKEVADMLASGKYSSVTMSEKGGGYVAIEKSRAKHKIEEIEAANILANKGYKVILKSEEGSLRTPDGYLFKASFEQITPQQKTDESVKRNIRHAKEKGAEVSVIYDRNEIYHKADIERGIKMFEESTAYRLKEIIVISKDGRVHKHRHNN